MNKLKYYKILNKEQMECETDFFTPFRYRQFYKYIPGGSRIILDIGCSTGRGGNELLNLNSDLILYGLDCVKKRLNVAKKIYKKVIEGVSTSIPLEDNSADCILAGEFIEHLKITDVKQSLKEFYRIIKNGGRLLLTTPNPAFIKNKVLKKSVLGGAHLSQHYPEDLKKVLIKLGFKNVFIKGSGKTSIILGDSCPFLFIYGSYLLSASK